MPASLGKYYDIIKAGEVFIVNTAAAGTATPLITGTAATFGLWNTTASHNAVLLKINIGFTSGTIAVGQFGLGALNVPAFQIATGGSITAFTDATMNVTLRSAKLGQTAGPRMRATPSAATIAASTSFPFYWLGSSITAATGAQPGWTMAFDLDGLIVPPGQFVHLAGSIAQTALFSASLMWAEVPI